MEILTESSTLVPSASANPKYRTFVKMNHVLSDKESVVKVLQEYKESINAADADAGSLIWSTSLDVSMIHPNGREKGWDQIRSNMYGMFRRNFIFRNLTSRNERITLHGDVALLEFDWDFEALLKSENMNNSVEWGCWDNLSSGSDEKNRIVKSRGRESMLLRKFGYEWKIVHIHYSGLPAADGNSAH
jgi:ketosteroid isomerase-like protein